MGNDMDNTATKNSLSITLYLLIAASGFATLAWEVLWQIKATLALGVSAWGTAITLAVIMGGMSLGGFLMGKKLLKYSGLPAVRMYGLLEIMAGIAGLFLNAAFQVLEALDAWAYRDLTTHAAVIYVSGILVIVGIPTLCMGATFPIFGVIAQEFKISLSKLYSLNTLGAALGTLFVALILIPLFGITHTIWIVATINIGVGISAWVFFSGSNNKKFPIVDTIEAPLLQVSLLTSVYLVFITGFATFTLEIAWFRSLMDVLPNTTDIFAILLACTLVGLGLAAKKVSVLKQQKKSLGTQLFLAGVLILLVTPLIEHLGNISAFLKHTISVIKPIHALPLRVSDYTLPEGFIDAHTFIVNWMAVIPYVFYLATLFLLISVFIIPPMFFLGVAFPWIVDSQRSVSIIGKLYAINTLAAIVGSISAAWILLPTLGFAKTAWIAGIVVVTGGVIITDGKKRFVFAVLSIIAITIAIFFESGIGKTHVEGYFSTDSEGRPATVLEFYEAPDATIAAVEYADGGRALLINSVLAAWEAGSKARPSIHYMAWMGHLPMLLHPNPKKALVICFGTGQTANAVRQENPQQLDIVDLNQQVFQLAHNFKSNENVLNDARVKAIVMDGRAYLRRTSQLYDVITLEPMPPGTTNVNALYSHEFYVLARAKLAPHGVIAQWLPFHGLAPYYLASIAKTFRDVFPNAILWLDPKSNTGILLGSTDNDADLTMAWPGLARTVIPRNLSNREIQDAIALNAIELARYSQFGEEITDDNQLLSYGRALYISSLVADNFKLLHQINQRIKAPTLDQNYQ
jgi:spermidine synthase